MDRPLEKILFAEDEPDIRMVVGIALEDVGGFELKTCHDGMEAVEAVGGFKPDLLLFDVMMPRMDGPTALREIRRMAGFEALPVVFMTAKAQPGEIAEYREMGALDVICKPFDPMTLAATLRQIWSRATQG